MQWPDLQTFAQVAEELSFSSAAGRLHLTTSAVVRRIQRLERDLGCRLLDRSTTHVALTDAGALLAARLPALAAHWQQVAADVAGPPPTPLGLRLGLIELCSKMMVEHLVAAMPDIELDWLTDDSAALLAMLQRRELDMALLARFPMRILRCRPVPTWPRCSTNRSGSRWDSLTGSATRNTSLCGSGKRVK